MWRTPRTPIVVLRRFFFDQPGLDGSLRSGVSGVIATERLALVPLPAELLALIARDEIERAVERRLAAQVPARWTQTIPAQLRLQPLAADRSEQPWLVRAMVLRTARRVVGSVGFHGPAARRADAARRASAIRVSRGAG